MKIYFGLSILAVSFVATACDTKIDFVLSARNLPDTDNYEGAPDPYVVLFYARNMDDSFSEWGQSLYFKNQNDPDWPEVYSFNYTGKLGRTTHQRFKVEIYDSDYETYTLIGSVEFHLHDLVDSNGFVLTKELIPEGCGQLVVYGQVNG